MAYTKTNFTSKAAVKRALAAGDVVEVYQPGPFGPEVKDGSCALEGPHYPAPHSWYASAVVKDGKLVSIK
jgi:hypothetical protein